MGKGSSKEPEAGKSKKLELGFVRWRWQNKAAHDYAFDVGAGGAAEHAYQAYQCDPASHKVVYKIGASMYELDLKDMLQKNIATGYLRKVVRLDDVELLRLLAMQVCTNEIVLEQCHAKEELQALQAKYAEETQRLSTRVAALEVELKEHSTITRCLSARVAALEEEVAAEKRGHLEVSGFASALRERLESEQRERAEEKRLLSERLEAMEKRIAAEARSHAEEVINLTKRYESESTQLQRSHEEEKQRLAQRLEDQGQRKAAEAQHNRTEIARLEMACASTEDNYRTKFARLEKECASTEDNLYSLEALWRDPCTYKPPVLCSESFGHVERAELLLRKLSHLDKLFQGKQSRCFPFTQARILHMRSVHNPALWKKYLARKDEMRSEHQRCGIKLKPLPAPASGLVALLDRGVCLDTDINEEILVHGCLGKVADAIVREGFDLRRSGTGAGALYGEGIYFASEPCKANQYTKQEGLRSMIIARVAVGDPSFPKHGCKGRLPNLRDITDDRKGRYDSHVIIPSNSERGQAHLEYVIFNSDQVYPEFVVEYEVP
eukprot:NODE_2927_length_2120_cov_3.662318.p1 GENE.NODE_2927_length_2120_cov_3.662318~~NODE_2927_length_2120_cov_3.662318.p1  ORF type:complete len:552 (-),score=103.19 NODE_2927_length_2120_cov_3.662318:353-2008(-)